jgi:DNA polymerase-3 subunit beta
MKAICGDQRAIRLKLGDNSVELSGDNPERGHVSERIGGTLTGPDLEIGFNPRYLEQTLRLSGDVSFLLIDSASPARFEFSGRPDCCFVLMPMRLRRS